MSLASQTADRPRMPFGLRLALTLVAMAALIVIAMGGVWDVVGRRAAAASLHAPDLSLLAGLSPAIKIHLATALLALALGAVLMVVRKGRTFHRTAGWVWVSLVATTAGSTLFITTLNHGAWSLLHLLTAWTLIVLPLAVIWARRHEVARHRRTMMGLFYGGFAINLAIAFIPGRTLWNVFLG